MLADPRCSAAPDGRYLHWDQLRYRPPPEGLQREEWWTLIQLARGQHRRRDVPLVGVDSCPFTYLVDPIWERLHYIDRAASGNITISEQVTNPETRDRYIVSSLIEEAITSSQLEGATTTRSRAKELIRSRRAPTDLSERMILSLSAGEAHPEFKIPRRIA